MDLDERNNKELQ